jgi:REP element-mobilizing transposase RayT
MTIARQVVAGRTYLISRRCTQRQMLLRPDERVEQIYLYCLAEAVERYGMTLHGYVAMSNHQHLVVRDNQGNYPAFLAHLNKMTAKAINHLRGRGENFWATEQPNAVYLVEKHDRFAKLVYLLANPVASDLVDRVSDWPGACSWGLSLSGRTMTVRRPRGGFFRSDSTMPAEVPLRVERPEGFEADSDEEWRAKLEEAVRGEEQKARAERVRSRRGILGRKGVLRAVPTDTAKTVEPRGQLRPHLACRNEERRIAELVALVAFRVARGVALQRFLRGERDVVFPQGTYRVHARVHSMLPLLALSA